jgi:hypothetical protein
VLLKNIAMLVVMKQFALTALKMNYALVAQKGIQRRKTMKIKKLQNSKLWGCEHCGHVNKSESFKALLDTAWRQMKERHDINQEKLI